MRKRMNFNVIDYTKFIDMVSDSTLQLTFKKQSFFEFGYHIKENPHLSEKAMKILSFPTAYLWESGFSSLLLPKQHIATD